MGKNRLKVGALQTGRLSSTKFSHVTHQSLLHG